MKTCSRCRVEKELKEFGLSSKSKDGRQYHCRTCKAELHQENRDARIQSIRKSKARRVTAAREYIVSIMGSGCVDCGNTDIRVLEFDHTGNKTMGVGTLVAGGWSLQRIKDEISNCEIRCKNCHVIKTYERLGETWHNAFVSPLTSNQEKG